jgi:hypothetical protein
MTILREVTHEKHMAVENLPFIQYCARVQRDSGQTSTSFVFIAQNLENINSAAFIGKTVTLSFYARAGANFSAASSILTANLYSGTGSDQNYANVAITGQATVATTNATLTSTWQRFTVSGTVATSAKQLIIVMQYTPVGTAGAADYFETTGVQLEVGNQATPYTPATPTYATELAACQRYYCRWTGGAAYHPYGLGFATSTTAGAIIVNSPVAMRVAPTTIDYSTIYLEDYASASSTAGTVSAFNAGPLVTKLNFTGLSGMTAGRGIYIYSNNDANGYLAFSAEL